jgi:FtsH-binding integral membrane protein
MQWPGLIGFIRNRLCEIFGYGFTVWWQRFFIGYIFYDTPVVHMYSYSIEKCTHDRVAGNSSTVAANLALDFQNIFINLRNVSFSFFTGVQFKEMER